MTNEPHEVLGELASFRAYDRSNVERLVFAARVARADGERELAEAMDRVGVARSRLAGVAGLERLLQATIIEAHRALAEEERENQAAIDAILYAAGRQAETIVEAARAEAALAAGRARVAPAGAAVSLPPSGRRTDPSPEA